MNYERTFLTSNRPHVLMITNHGIHQWQIVPGLPDTGGQNVFVNEFSASLADKGRKTTIVNRGGYPHPNSGEKREGVHYKDQNQRILYLEDDLNQFVRKEDMDERLPVLSSALNKHLQDENLQVDVIISHYWDGAKLGLLFNKTQANPVPHIWVPHSLGAIKKKNVNPDQWADLRIDKRIANERQIIREVDGIAATSAKITESLQKDYGYTRDTLFLPPCVDPNRYHPKKINKDHPIWAFLSQHCKLAPGEIYQSNIVTEISRTDKTKRKDVLIKAFAEIIQNHPNAVLIVSIDKSANEYSKNLRDLIHKLGIERRVAVVGSVWDELPDIYAVTDIYCTPSIMEGFGMTSQEAAATAVPVISSDLVPFVTEYLLGDPVEKIPIEGGQRSLQIGQGGVVVPADDIHGFAQAINLLLSDPDLRRKLGENAYKITIPYFTWGNVVGEFLDSIQQLISNDEAE